VIEWQWIKFALHIMGKYEVWYDSSYCEIHCQRISAGAVELARMTRDGNVASPAVLSVRPHPDSDGRDG
jgi:hypothetical protein